MVTVHRSERGLPFPGVGPISYYIQHRGKPSRQKPAMYSNETVIAYFERGKGKRVLGKELTSDYKFKHYRP